MGYLLAENLDLSRRLWFLDTLRPLLHVGCKIVIERTLIRNGILPECDGVAGAVSGVSTPRCWIWKLRGAAVVPTWGLASSVFGFPWFQLHWTALLRSSP